MHVGKCSLWLTFVHVGLVETGIRELTMVNYLLHI